jgi:hypothetical protein
MWFCGLNSTGVREILVLDFTELAMNLQLSKDVNIFRAFWQILASQGLRNMEPASSLCRAVSWSGRYLFRASVD